MMLSDVGINGAVLVEVPPLLVIHAKLSLGRLLKLRVASPPSVLADERQRSKREKT